METLSVVRRQPKKEMWHGTGRRGIGIAARRGGQLAGPAAGLREPHGRGQRGRDPLRFGRLVFPKKNGAEVKGGSGRAPARIPPGTRIPGRSVGGRGCKTLRRTRRCSPWPPRGWCTSRDAPTPASGWRRNSRPARYPALSHPAHAAPDPVLTQQPCVVAALKAGHVSPTCSAHTTITTSFASGGYVGLPNASIAPTHFGHIGISNTWSSSSFIRSYSRFRSSYESPSPTGGTGTHES